MMHPLEYIRRKRISNFEKEFRKLTIRDQSKVTAICMEDGGALGHINFLTMFLYQDMYNDAFRVFNDCVVKKPHVVNGTLFCQYPIGSPQRRKNSVQKIVDLYSTIYKEVKLFGATEEQVAEARAMFGKSVAVIENDRDNANYVLDLKEQIALEGSKFSDRRSKLSRFSKVYSWSHEVMTRESLKECILVNQQWYKSHARTNGIDGEQRALSTALKYFDELHLDGDIIRIDEHIAAFAIGAPFNSKIYSGFFMKALREYRNVSSILEQAVIKSKCDFSYINISDDSGITGLRNHKLEMHPAYLEPFYNITLYPGK